MHQRTVASGNGGDCSFGLTYNGNRRHSLFVHHQRPAPRRHLFAQPGNRNTLKTLRTSHQVFLGFGKERHRSLAIATLMVTERNGDLNHTVQKRFFDAIGPQPNGLPMLMRFKKLCAVVTDQSFRQRSLCPIQGQFFRLPIVCFQLNGRGAQRAVPAKRMRF